MATREYGRLLAAKELVRPYLRWGYYGMFPQRRPERFVECWKYPEHVKSPEAVEETCPPDVLFFPMNDWHARTQRAQHLARAFAALGHRCLYLNPNLGCEYHRPYLAEPESRVSVLGERILELHVHLPREHAHHRRLLTESETGRIVLAVRELVHSLKVQHAVLLLSFPIWLEAARLLRDVTGFPIVYDCHDYLAGFKNVAREISARESEVFHACDLAVFSSEPLKAMGLAAVPEVGAKSVVARNAVDPAQFRERADLCPGVVGYLGALDHWFDVEGMERAARDHPEYQFRIFGRVEDERVERLRACPNVELAGERPYSEVPALMEGFRVALIPFLRTPLTMATNPIKLYEYFSLGLPVVSARLPEVERYGDLVYLVDSPTELSSQIERAMLEDDPARRARRMEIAQRESWRARAMDLLEAFRAL